MQGKKPSIVEKSYRKRASTPRYVSPNQLLLSGFETPFEQQLNKNNRWVKLSHLIPWDKIVGQYDNQHQSKEGRPAICGRVVLGALIIKHILNLTCEFETSWNSESFYFEELSTVLSDLKEIEKDQLIVIEENKIRITE